METTSWAPGNLMSSLSSGIEYGRKTRLVIELERQNDLSNVIKQRLQR